MDNPETLATLDTKDIGPRKTNQSKTKNNMVNEKDDQHWPFQNPGGCGAVPGSYKTPTCYSYIQPNPRKVLTVIE